MQLFFRSFGEGEPLIILHGLYGISDNWVTQAKDLAASYKVFIPDMRNHGQSGHSNVFNYDAMTADIAEFIDTHQLSNPVIIGHSMGGKVAMKFALENPGNVSNLIIVDVSMRQYHYREYHLKLMHAMTSIDFSKVQSRKDVELLLTDAIEDVRTRLFIMKNLHWTERRSLSWRINIATIMDNIDYIFEGVSSSTIFDNPALFIRGADSDYVIESDFAQIYHNFPQADIKTIEGAAHWVQADQPEAFMQAVKYFLNI
jgi:esterase